MQRSACVGVGLIGALHAAQVRRDLFRQMLRDSPSGESSVSAPVKRNAWKCGTTRRRNSEQGEGGRSISLHYSNTAKEQRFVNLLSSATQEGLQRFTSIFFESL